jgi:hypothetical protein
MCTVHSCPCGEAKNTRIVLIPTLSLEGEGLRERAEKRYRERAIFGKAALVYYIC